MPSRSKYSATPLTDKQERFAEEYLVDLNATQAAIRAGYSERSAGAVGHDLLKNSGVVERLKVLRNKQSDRTKITADRVILELARVAFVDIADVLEWDGQTLKIKPFKDLTPDHRAAIAEFNESATPTGVNQRIKFHDKLGALEKLGKHLGLFKETIDLNINPQKPLEEMTDEELAEYRASLMAVASRTGEA